MIRDDRNFRERSKCLLVDILRHLTWLMRAISPFGSVERAIMCRPEACKVVNIAVTTTISSSRGQGNGVERR